jgi:hypothetical protein
MLRLSMLFWMAVAIGVGLLLYNVKHEVQGLEQQLARTNRAIGVAHERIHVLHAEWSLLNEPDRLRALSERHLDLVQMRPAQFVGTTAIAALPVASPSGDTAVAVAEPAATPQPVASRTTPAAAPPETRRQPEQRREPEQRRTGRPAEARQAEPPARLAPQREEPMPLPRQAAPAQRRELEATAPRQLLPTTPANSRATAPVIAVSATPQPARAPTSSSLGGPGAALPPPVPFSRPSGGN